ncbi:hypothetical protein [Polaribacter sp. IC073]|uniref:hypothetical protein n=1 Tax=Polaribacter sp. IC073 TaxID=2508540 RepID=UPI0011BEE79E|nr:hypothetical protein [Polaribacter sp. IC073]TXD47725.1 hypothetical protein ES045_10580 [Polaribacter sp. IC073]
MEKEEKKLTPEEVQLELLSISKDNNKKFESMRKNIQFIVWYLIISIIVTFCYLAVFYGKTGAFRAY